MPTEKDPPKKESTSPDIYVLSIPGGGMLGILPAMALDYIEKLTETPTSDLFQVIDSASTGAILNAALTVRDPEHPEKPKYTAEEAATMYCRHGPEMFPEMPARMAKMVTANILGVAEDFFDPLKTDYDYIEEIRETIGEMRKAASAGQWPLIDELEQLALTRWISKSQKSRCLDICDKLSHDEDNPLPQAGDVSELVFLRRHSASLTKVFRKAALGLIDKGKDWAKDYRYDPGVPARLFQEFLGDVRMSDCRNSTYIWTYDVERNSAYTFMGRKKDLFSAKPDTRSDTTKGNPKLTDAVMGSIANGFAYPNYITEDGVRCEDLATVHTPLWTVHDILKNKPRGTKIKLVFMGTGSYFSKSHDEDGLKADQDNGIIEKFIRGRIANMLKNYTMSQARSILRKELGRENIIEFSPRLSPRTVREEDKVPSKNILNASPENIRNIIETGYRFLEEQEPRLRELASQLVDNLYKAGSLDEEKYLRVKQKIDSDYKPEPFRFDLPEPKAPSPGKRIRTFFNKVADHLRAAPEQDNIDPATIKKKTGTNGPGLTL